MAARLGELRLSHEAIGSPRQVGYLTWKSFGGPGELEASLGKPGFRKLSNMTLLPLRFGIFRIPDQNVERSLILCGD